MPGPPTPVSCCPLKRLEIRDGVWARTYDSCRPQSIFTLTVEGERRLDAETGTLIVLIHHGTQQVISIRIGDLARSSHAPDEIASIDKQLHQLCINIPGKFKTIGVQFEEKRDFTLTVCLLQQSGLHVKDSVPTSLLTASPPTRQASAFDAPSSFGPRVSTITPPLLSPNNVHNFGTQSHPSFTAMLNAPFQYTPTVPSFQPMPSPQISYPQRAFSLPDYSSPSGLSSMPVSQSNPYNTVLGRGSPSMHIPRVGSPLKYSFNPEQPRSQSLHSIPGSPLPSPQLYSHTNGEYLPAAVPKPASAPPLDASHTHHSRRAEASAPKDGVAFARSGGESATKFNDGQKALQAGVKDFRDLMPRPRKLPFEPRPKRPASLDSPAIEKEESRCTSQSKRSRSLTNTDSNLRDDIPKVKTAKPNVAVCRVASRDTECQTDMDMGSTASGTPSIETPPVDTPHAASRDAECQTTMDMGSTTSTASGTLSTKTPLVQTPRTLISVAAPTLLVTDPGTLKELDQATAGLFEQYEADVASGSDKSLSAKFYMDRISAKRRDFWLTKLQGLQSWQWRGSS
ncbi:hypothetical protein ACJZ2D_005102 [Fusarium nematophilum]